MSTTTTRRSTAQGRPIAKRPAKPLKGVVYKRAAQHRKSSPDLLFVSRSSDASVVAKFVDKVKDATPLQMVEIERQGVAGNFVKALAKTLELPAVRVFDMLGLPKATVEKKAASGDALVGSGGQAAIGMARLIGVVQDIVANSTAREAKEFSATKWLGQWLERPQPSLGGRRPSEFLDTPTGVDVVARLLGSAESGAYL